MSPNSDDDGVAPTLADIPVVSHILTPGSSLDPTFLLIVDAAFVSLLLVLIFLLFITSYNLHFFVLICITLVLWASVKWFVHELRQAPPLVDDLHSAEKIAENRKDK